MDMGNYDLSWSVGFMFDTTLALTRMIFDGFFDLYPKLKLIASHGGGALPYLVGRLEKGNEVELPQRRKMTAKPTDYLRHIYYDCINYDAGALQYLVSVVVHLAFVGTDGLGCLLVIRALVIHWPKRVLRAADRFGAPIVQPLVDAVMRSSPFRQIYPCRRREVLSVAILLCVIAAIQFVLEALLR